MTEAPCKDCNSRDITCHIEGNCPMYTKWKKQCETRRLEVMKAKGIYSQYSSFVIMCRNTALRELRHKK